MIRGVRYLHTPRGLTQVPLPKTAIKNSDISKHITLPEAGATRRFPAAVQALFPETVSAESLVDRPANGHKVWYNVSRTHMGNLPVYTDFNNAGGVWTEVRRISGDVSALRADLKQHLGLDKKDIWIQDTSKRIIIKGNHSQAIKKILEQYF